MRLQVLVRLWTRIRNIEIVFDEKIIGVTWFIDYLVIGLRLKDKIEMKRQEELSLRLFNIDNLKYPIHFT